MQTLTEFVVFTPRHVRVDLRVFSQLQPFPKIKSPQLQIPEFVLRIRRRWQLPGFYFFFFFFFFFSFIITKVIFLPKHSYLIRRFDRSRSKLILSFFANEFVYSSANRRRRRILVEGYSQRSSDDAIIVFFLKKEKRSEFFENASWNFLLLVVVVVVHFYARVFWVCFFLLILCVFTFLCVFQYYSRYTKEAHAHAYCLEFISLSLSLFVCKSDYNLGLFSIPCSYDQPCGKGQSLSRRYCKHSGWLFSCADRTVASPQGALTSSCKYLRHSR